MASRNLDIGFIGIGVLGRGLSLALAERGYRVVGAHSRSKASARWLADRIPGCDVYASVQALSDASGLVFITTPDSAIEDVTRSVNWRSGQGVVHCYGGASIELLKSAAQQGAMTGAFHPFQTFAGLASPEEAAARLSGVTFAVDGEGWIGGYLHSIAEDLDGHSVSISGEDRPLYHAAAVFGCGYLVALLKTAVSLWETMGFSPEQAIQALIPLSSATLGNVAREGVAAQRHRADHPRRRVDPSFPLGGVVSTFPRVGVPVRKLGPGFHASGGRARPGPKPIDRHRRTGRPLYRHRIIKRHPAKPPPFRRGD